MKATQGAAAMIGNLEPSRKLEMFQKYVAEIQDALSLRPKDRPSKPGLETPIEVMDTPFRAGDLNHGYQAVIAPESCSKFPFVFRPAGEAVAFSGRPFIKPARCPSLRAE